MSFCFHSHVNVNKSQTAPTGTAAPTVLPEGAKNSLKVVGKNQIYVDWNSEKKINSMSYINVKDGILNVQSVKLPAGNNKVYYGIRITGGNLQLDTSTIFSKGQLYNNLFLTSSGWLLGIIKETKNTTTFTDKQYGF